MCNIHKCFWTNTQIYYVCTYNHAVLLNLEISCSFVKIYLAGNFNRWLRYCSIWKFYKNQFSRKRSFNATGIKIESGRKGLGHPCRPLALAPLVDRLVRLLAFRKKKNFTNLFIVSDSEDSRNRSAAPINLAKYCVNVLASLFIAGQA